MSSSRDPNPNWPPRSPRDALLSTPGGRRRYQQMMDQTSPSPSPRRPRTANSYASPSVDTADIDMDDDEDEEVLQLKLQELQAKLKLKRLQAAKAREKKDAGIAEARKRTGELSSWAMGASASPRTERATTPEPRLIPQDPVQVHASPVRRVQTQQEPKSPRRIELGIDKGLKAGDISLKRAPSLWRGAKPQELGQQDGYLRRSRTPNLAASQSSEVNRPMTFSERLASVRTEEISRAEKKDRIQQTRSKTFGIGQDEIDKYKKTAVEIPYEAPKAPKFSREEVLGQGKPTSGDLRRSNTASSTRTGTGPHDQSMEEGHEEGTSFEPYSSFHLSRRILPHRVMARHLSGKQAYNIKDVLRDVKAPDFALPDIEQDIVIFGIVAKKSDPRAHKPVASKNGETPEDRGKYMVMTLVDLEWELDLFLFNTGFTRFWKLTEGTVVAILNPTIMPPPPGRQDTGRFSLVINSDEDTIIEIGIARDLGACQSIKKDGGLCASWINKRRTQFCEFHTNEALKKTRASRVEMNGAGFGDVKPKSKDYVPKKKAPRNWDWETKTQFFATRSMSAADLIDGKDRTAGEKKEREEGLKRRLVAQEKERELMKKLGKIGNGAGKAYMQHASQSNDTPGSSLPSDQGMTTSEISDPLNLAGRERTVHLSSINKRKRADSSQAGSIAGGSQTSALGWGNSLKSKLARMKEGEKLRKEVEPPVRKKTRFVTEKGIRVAGRESLGMDLSDRQVDLEDDDDELVILR